MNKIRIFLAAFIAVAFIFTSCEEDQRIVGKFENGALITNEGGWGATNASVSFLNYTTNAIEDNIYTHTNGRPLGDVLQSAYISNDKIFLVLNGSSKVEVANISDITEVGTIEGINSPRYLTVANGNAYITQWGDGGKVKVANTTSFAITNTISVGKGPEGIIQTNGLIWVANGGGLTVDSTISVINPTSNEVIKTIKLGNHNPKKLVVDKNGDIWALCYGYIKYKPDYSIEKETPSGLVKISSTTKEVLKSFTISDNQHPMQLEISKNGQTLYFGGGFGYTGIYAVDIAATALPTTPLINASFYSFNVNPANDDLYCLEAISFTSAGKLKKYSSAGQLIEDYTVGIGPNGAIFQ